MWPSAAPCSALCMQDGALRALRPTSPPNPPPPPPCGVACPAAAQGREPPPPQPQSLHTGGSCSAAMLYCRREPQQRCRQRPRLRHLQPRSTATACCTAATTIASTCNDTRGLSAAPRTPKPPQTPPRTAHLALQPLHPPTGGIGAVPHAGSALRGQKPLLHADGGCEAPHLQAALGVVPQLRQGDPKTPPKPPHTRFPHTWYGAPAGSSTASPAHCSSA